MISSKRKQNKDTSLRQGAHRKELDPDQLNLLVSQGLTHQKIAEIMGVSKITITRRLNPGLLKKHSNWQMFRQRRAKSTLIKEAGFKCALCPYSDCEWALDFHHIKPEEKEFSISSQRHKSLSVLRKEAAKCILLCRNCHNETHDGFHEEEMKRIRKEYEEAGGWESIYVPEEKGKAGRPPKKEMERIRKEYEVFHDKLKNSNIISQLEFEF